MDTTCRLAIVGEGGYTDGYVAELRALAAGDPRIVFTGLQSGGTLHSLFRFAAAYVQASELEGLPLSVLECLDHAIPPIASDIPPHRELLEPIGEYDLFFEPGDVEALRERITRVLGNRDRYARWADGARRHVHELYAWPAVADRVEEISRRAIQRRR